MRKVLNVRRILSFLVTRAGIAAGCAVAALAIFARFSAEIGESDKLKWFDTSVLHYFKTHQITGVHEIMAAFTFLGGPILQTVVLCLCIAYFFWNKQRSAALTLLFAGIIGLGAVSGLKLLFHRPRPELIFAPLGYSFPSGHSFFAVVVYGLTAYFVARQQKTRKHRRLAYAVGVMLVFLVGFSRIYLGQHYPSDVGAGYTAGFFWAWFCTALPPSLWRYWQKRRGKHLDARVEA